MSALSDRWRSAKADARVVGWWGALKLRLYERMGRHFKRLKKLRYSLRVRDPELLVFLRAASSDQCSFEQVFVERQYGCIDFLKEPRLIVDCGANVGHASLWFLARFPTTKVLAVEPEPSNCELCRINLAPFAGRVRVQNVAVWSCNRRVSIVRGAFRDKREWATQVSADVNPGEGEVDAMDLSTLLASVDGDVDLLKVDVEGAERVMFTGATGWLNRVRNLAIEIHDKECRKAVMAALSPYSFDLFESGELSVFKGIRRA